MQVASLELSKQLFEVSGWPGDASWWNTDNGQLSSRFRADTAMFYVPAYTLSFLIRKLPPFTKVWFDSVGRDRGWYAYNINENLQCRGDTPEDCVARLALALFEAGILTREGE